MRALVTGASGFVGSHLVDHLVDAGREVIALVRRNSDLTWLRDTPVDVHDLGGDDLPAQTMVEQSGFVALGKRCRKRAQYFASNQRVLIDVRAIRQKEPMRGHMENHRRGTLLQPALPNLFCT